jgi:hypothetical protein
MTIAAFILGAIGTLTGCLALYVQWLSFRRDAKKFQLELIREQQASEPFFKWLLGRTIDAHLINRLDVCHEFKNEGESVTDLEIKAAEIFQASIYPKDILGKHQEGKVEFYLSGVKRYPDIAFEIHYSTRLNKRSKQSFVLLANGTVEKIKG